MFKKIFNCKNFWIGEKSTVLLDGEEILILHTETGIHVFQNRCPHAGAPLNEGSIENGVLTCARHGWQFCTDTGHGINPVNTQLKTYHFYIDASDDLWIDTEKNDEH